jgi:hypothetical protein
MNRKQGDRKDATRGKLILVGVLVVVLVCVLASNFRGSANEPAPVAPSPAADARGPAPAPVAAQATTVQAPAASLGPFGEFAADGDWPAAALVKLVSIDPLKAPPWMAVSETVPTEETAADPMQQTLEQVQQAQSAIIFISGGHRGARIGTQDYHVGDMVGRFQISDISSAGIVLSEPVGDARDRK